MRLAINSKLLATPSCALLIAAAASVTLYTPAFAQDAPEASTATQPEGQVIYSRDVPYGSAIGPRLPGREGAIVTGPTNLILRSIATGLKPMTDDESAGVAASTNSQIGIMRDSVSLGLGALSNVGTSSGATSHIGSIQGSTISGAVNTATGALQDALGSMRNALGGGK